MSRPPVPRVSVHHWPIWHAPIRPWAVFRNLTTRRLIGIVAVSAVVCSGFRAGDTPGWHVPLPGGLRFGACRNDGEGRWRLPTQAVYQAGVWRAGGHGVVVCGVERAGDRVVTTFVGARHRRVW